MAAGGTYTLVNGDEMLVGNVVGERYHVRDILGQGSTGTVFGTVHVHFERAGAMKVMRPRFTTFETLQRVFHNEARPAFTISHPSLCEVYDIGSLPDGTPFFVMERLVGDTLASRLGRERFSTAAAVDLLMQLLSVMEAVHAHELLFRDLRPQNIFLASRRGCRPVLKVLDFGLSRLVPLEKVQAQWDALRAVAAPGDASGALSIPYYLSPERARSEQGLEPASDLFVAAVIFYEALTAERPFDGATWNDLLGAIVRGQPTHVSVHRPDLPDELASLVMRSLSGHPRGRPASAREMQDELRAVFEGQKRGSTSLRASTVTAAAVEPAPPVSSRTLHMPPAPGGRAQASDDGFDDETRTDRKAFDVPDEASAEHPVRTLRPPGGVDIEIDVEVEPEGASTSRGHALADTLGLPAPVSPHDEETATMTLTPEVRAQIEQMTRAGRETEDSTRPPPTRRIPDKAPPRR